MMGHHGFIGLGIFLLLAFFTWLTASSIIRAAKRDKATMWLRDLMATVQVSLIAYLSAGAFLGLAYFDYFYNLVLIVAIGKLVLHSYPAHRSEADVVPVGAIRSRDAGTAAPVVRRL
jgi:hypothetical protein